MKKWRHYIQSSKYLNEDNPDVLIDDHILVDIDIDILTNVLSSFQSNSSTEVFFPGIEQFKQDVLSILEDEYRFEVIEDIHDGKLQKGYISNREDSISIYFDTYFDLSNSGPSIERLGITQLDIPEQGDKVYCFIHLRFSDHDLIDQGDKLHRKFITENSLKYTENRPDVTISYPDEYIEIPEKLLYRFYNEAIDTLKDELDFRIASWVKKAPRYKKLVNNR